MTTNRGRCHNFYKLPGDFYVDPFWVMTCFLVGVKLDDLKRNYIGVSRYCQLDLQVSSTNPEPAGNQA